MITFNPSKFHQEPIEEHDFLILNIQLWRLRGKVRIFYKKFQDSQISLNSSLMKTINCNIFIKHKV